MPRRASLRRKSALDARSSEAVKPLFTFKELTVAPQGLDGPRIFDRLDLELPERGITVLWGPSGIGKSTLLRLCNRLVAPDEGVVEMRGVDISTIDPLVLRRRVAMVFQHSTLFPGTVLDNLLVADPSLDRTAAASLLARAGLAPEFLDRVGDQLSGGEAQRCCLARALATSPQVLLMDEPTSALDAANARRIELLASDLAASGVPVVWVTHDLEQCERIAGAVVDLAPRLAP